ncbi:MAG: LysM peptidoglycan-binding domain-containing protein, partial [Candidatus Omnitrophica bacterium]|nr:LysM peptidoglycan-binding domain-containing protein [Candidatus Omnitrophota bacterium]
YKANRNTIKNPNRLYVGQKLTIPADEGEERRASVGGETIK